MQIHSPYRVDYRLVVELGRVAPGLFLVSSGEGTEIQGSIGDMEKLRDALSDAIEFYDRTTSPDTKGAQ